MRVTELLMEGGVILPWKGRRVAVKFSPDTDSPEADDPKNLWRLGTIDHSNDISKAVFVEYDDPSLNNEDIGSRFQMKSFAKPSKKDLESYALIKQDTPKSKKGLTDIADLRIPFVKYQPVDKTPAPKAEKSTPAKPTSGDSNAEKFTPTAAQIRNLENYAEDGDRIAADGKNIYMGFGNRSGLHSYLQTALADTFKKWPNAKKKLETGSFSKIEVLSFRNKDRDRGNWIVVKTITAPKS